MKLWGLAVVGGKKPRRRSSAHRRGRGRVSSRVFLQLEEKAKRYPLACKNCAGHCTKREVKHECRDAGKHHTNVTQRLDLTEGSQSGPLHLICCRLRELDNQHVVQSSISVFFQVKTNSLCSVRSCNTGKLLLNPGPLS